jgi:hypothetical protein
VELYGYAPAMIALLLVLSSSVHAQEPAATTPTEEPTAPAPAADPWREGFDAAVEVYLQGDLADARVRLGALAASGHPTDPHQTREAKAYLAEVEYYLGERESAWATFLEIATLDPEYRLDPFVHPPEVVAYFDSVRATSARLSPAPAIDPGPAPLGVILLPGALQIRNGQKGLGVFMAGTVAGLAAGTFALYGTLQRYDLDATRVGIQVGASEAQMATTLKNMTNASRSAAATVWALGVAQGVLRSRQTQVSGAVPPMAGPVLGFSHVW